MSPRNSVLAKRTLEVAEVCLRWKDLWRLSRYATVCLCHLSFWLHTLQKLFDILMASANFSANHVQAQSPQKDTRSLISHLLHIAASPPDNAQKPQYNNLPHLDSVNWDSIPAELRKVSEILWTRLGVEYNKHLAEKNQFESDQLKESTSVSGPSIIGSSRFIFLGSILIIYLLIGSRFGSSVPMV